MTAQAQPDQRRAQIIEAARAIIERDGTTKLTAAAVAQSVGVSRPLLYHYFADMDELAGEIIAQYVDEFEARFEQWYARHRSDSVEEGLPSCAEFLHRELNTTCPWGIEGPSLGPDGRTRTTYLARCSQIVSDGLANKDGALSAEIRARVPMPEKTMRVLMLGLAQYQQTQPGTEAGELRQIVSEGFGFGRPAPVPIGVGDTVEPPVSATRAGGQEAPGAPAPKRGFFERLFAGSGGGQDR